MPHVEATVRPLRRVQQSLTPRQQQVLRLVADGLTNREIAGSLRISIRTVEVHRFNLMRRMKVANVAQLVRQALVQGALPTQNFRKR
jgi:DNA-binding NarL/FixJ family response regulator